MGLGIGYGVRVRASSSTTTTGRLAQPVDDARVAAHVLLAATAGPGARCTWLRLGLID